MGAARSFAGAVRDIWQFYRETRKTAFLITALVLLALGILVVLTEKSVLMPFLYTIF